MFYRPSCYRHVIKELIHAFSCACIELWMHLGSLESTQEARVESRLSPRATLTLLSRSPNFPCASITRYTTLSMNQFLNSRLPHAFLDCPFFVTSSIVLGGMSAFLCCGDTNAFFQSFLPNFLSTLRFSTSSPTMNQMWKTDIGIKTKNLNLG